jgi:hypothetical protein
VHERENRLQGTKRLRPVVVFVTSIWLLEDDTAHSPFGENDKSKGDICHFFAKKCAVGFGDGKRKGFACVAIGAASVLLGTEGNDGVGEGLSALAMVAVDIVTVRVVVKTIGELSGDGETACRCKAQAETNTANTMSKTHLTIVPSHLK